MRIIFCANPLNNKKVDFDYEFEYKEAISTGIKTDLVILEELIMNNPRKAISKILESEVEDIAIYRGWMLKIEEYQSLYDELLKKNIRLINSPTEYKHCHYLPESYNAIQEHTPKTVWIKKEELQNLDKLHELVNVFENKSVVVKDYVKSCKHQWQDACFVPDVSDLENFNRVIHNLIRLRGDDFEGGIIIREFINLEFLIEHPKSKMPLAKEFRLFFLNKQLLQKLYYWDEGIYKNEIPMDNELKDLLNIVPIIHSNFFTMDIAKTNDGIWKIIELGDGQVSGLPYNTDLKKFYNGINKYFE